MDGCACPEWVVGAAHRLPRRPPRRAPSAAPARSFPPLLSPSHISTVGQLWFHCWLRSGCTGTRDPCCRARHARLRSSDRPGAPLRRHLAGDPAGGRSRPTRRHPRERETAPRGAPASGCPTTASPRPCARSASPPACGRADRGRRRRRRTARARRPPGLHWGWRSRSATVAVSAPGRGLTARLSTRCWVQVKKGSTVDSHSPTSGNEPRMPPAER